MFVNGYPFSQVDKKQGTGEHHLWTWKFNFKTDIRRFIVEVELYELNIYIIKYYADAHSESKNRYSIILNEGHASRIIRTCLNIMLHFYETDKSASFGFIGMNSYKKFKKGKAVDTSTFNTQRFRIYKRLMSNYFGNKTFYHTQLLKHSAYLMINRECKGVRKFKEKAQRMFSKIYTQLEHETYQTVSVG